SLTSYSACFSGLAYLLSFPTRRSSDLLHTKAPERLREFATDRTATEHNHAFGFFLQLIENGFVSKIGNLIDAFDSRDRRAAAGGDRKSTRLNSSHRTISYAVFCLKKKN